MSAPLTPRNVGSPRRVVSLEYETPQLLPSPALLGPSSGCWSGQASLSSNPTSASSRGKRTPRRIVLSEVEGSRGKYEGLEFVDIISKLSDSRCFHVIERIFALLDERDLYSVQCVSHKWNLSFTKDISSLRRHTRYIESMRLHVRTMGLENAPSPKLLCMPKRAPEAQPALQFGARNALSDLSNLSQVKREIKPKVKIMKSQAGSLAATTPSKPLSLAPGKLAPKLSGLTPEDATRREKKMTSAKKDSRMRRLRC